MLHQSKGDGLSITNIFYFYRVTRPTVGLMSAVEAYPMASQIDLKDSTVPTDAMSGGRLFHSLMVLGKKECWRMTSNRILVVFISTWISAYSQRFTEVPGNHHILFGENVSLVWNITAESGTFSSGVWLNNRDFNVMTKLGTEDSRVVSSYRSKIASFGQYGMTVLDVAKEDDGKYTAVLTCLRANGEVLQLNEEGFIHIYDMQLPLEVTMSLVEPLRNGSEVMIDQDVTVTVLVPPNDPPAINISISVSYLNGSSTTEDCTNRNETTPCIYDFKVAQLGLIQIEACLKHPAVSIQPCEKTFLSGQDPNTPTSSLAPDDTSVSTDTLPSTEDKGPDDPGAECKWWCILLIVLAVLAILGIIVGLMYHYRLACFRSKSSAQIDVNQKQETNGFGLENKAY